MTQRETLIRRLKDRAGLTDEQARRAAEVFEDFLAEQSARQEKPEGPEAGLFSGSYRLFERHDR